MIVIYHANCTDGFCCAWLLRKRFPEAVFVPANYGEEVPDVEGEDVIIADFSYKREIMEEIIEKCKSLMVLDHHKSAQKELSGLVDPSIVIEFDMERSGAKMVADWLGVSNWLVDYVQDRDLWRWKLEDSRAVNAYISSWPFKDEVWDGIEKHSWDAIVKEGEAILRYQERCVESQIGKAVYVMFETKDGPKEIACMNCTHLVSEIAGKLGDGMAFGSTYFRRMDGKYVFSLRSEEGGMDVSEVAGGYGGGGHARAAGFEVDSLWF